MLKKKQLTKIKDFNSQKMYYFNKYISTIKKLLDTTYII